MMNPEEYNAALKRRAEEILEWNELSLEVRGLLFKILLDHAAMIGSTFPALRSAAPGAVQSLVFHYYPDGSPDLGMELFMVSENPPGEVVGMAHIKHARQGLLIEVAGSRYRVQRMAELTSSDKDGEQWMVRVTPEG